MPEPNLAELRQSCVSRGLCSAAAFDDALRTQREMSDRGETLSVIDVLVLTGTLAPEHAREVRTKFAGAPVVARSAHTSPAAAIMGGAPGRAPGAPPGPRRGMVRFVDEEDAAPPESPSAPAPGAPAHGTVSLQRAQRTETDLPAPDPTCGGTLGFDAEDLRAALQAAPAPKARTAAPQPVRSPSGPSYVRNPAPTASRGIAEPTLDESALGLGDDQAAPGDGGGSGGDAGDADTGEADAPQAPSGPEVPFGADLGGREIGGCRLDRELGRGAMGVVFEATHLSLQRKVAIKVLMPSAKRNEKDVEQFFQEARALARVEHQNIVQVYDVGEDDGLHYLAMQLLDGETIADRLDRVRVLSWEDTARMARDAAKGLAVAHDAGIVHRDIKPENIFVTTDGVVKIADFGLAAQAALQDDGPRTEVMGTPAYMSPEQIDGRAVDGRADLYSLGCTMYVMLTGRKPFEGATAIEVLLKQTKEVATPVSKVVPSVPPSVSQVVEKLMAKQPQSRYQKAADLAADLEKILGGGKPKVVVEIEDVMGRMQELIREAEQPHTSFWGKPPVVIACASVVVAAAALLLSVALPVVEVPTLDRDAILGPEVESEQAEATAKAALADTEALVEKLGDRMDLVQTQYAALEKRWGHVYLGPIAASRELAVARYEKRRDEAIAEARVKAGGLLRTDPVGAVETLMSLPADYRTGGDAAGWAQDLEKAVAALRSATGMTYVSGGRAVAGPDRENVDTAAFLIDTTEVTNAEYARFVEGTGARPPKHWGGKEPPASIRDLPVVGVTSKEADQFAKWSGKRLPTAAEWERAARGTGGSVYPWGDEFDTARAVCRLPEARPLVPVRTYSGGRSPEGAFHLAGNAAEWTADVATDPTLAGCREVRGGSAKSHPSQCTGFARYWMPEDTADPDLLIGFRCARDVR